jgi:hypothetical protein
MRVPRPVAASTLLPSRTAVPRASRTSRIDESGQILRGYANGVADSNVGQLAPFDEPIERRGAHPEVLGDLSKGKELGCPTGEGSDLADWVCLICAITGENGAHRLRFLDSHTRRKRNGINGIALHPNGWTLPIRFDTVEVGGSTPLAPTRNPQRPRSCRIGRSSRFHSRRIPPPQFTKHS